MNGVADDEDIQPDDNPAIDENDLLDFLKRCTVKNDLIDIKKKLTESVSIRKKFLRKSMAEIQEIFPFYFADPRLVITYTY